MSGSLEVWQRETVSGITLHMNCDGRDCADAVLLWHTADPSHMATDLGSGLERLLWLLSPVSWAGTVFGADAERVDIDVLDAIRTAVLLVMAGIRSSGDGAGGALRRVAHRIPVKMAVSGLGRLVRAQRMYWTDVGMSGPVWPQVTEVVEGTVLRLASWPYANNSSL